MAGFLNWMVGWLVGWPVGRLVDCWLVVWLVWFGLFFQLIFISISFAGVGWGEGVVFVWLVLQQSNTTGAYDKSSIFTYPTRTL